MLIILKILQENLRLDPTNGNSKIILNAVGVPNDEDFLCQW